MPEPDKPEHECPRCGRKTWEDVAGFGSFRPVWACGYCGLQAETPERVRKEA